MILSKKGSKRLEAAATTRRGELQNREVWNRLVRIVSVRCGGYKQLLFGKIGGVAGAKE
jgi:hypothetical protein